MRTLVTAVTTTSVHSSLSPAVDSGRPGWDIGHPEERRVEYYGAALR